MLVVGHRFTSVRGTSLIRCFLLALVIGFIPVGQAREQAGATIVVSNVSIPDSEEGEEDVTVNLIVQEGVLQNVTKDGLPKKPGIPVYDARGGSVLGKLEVGETAAFIIFDEDPRENVRIILNTEQHVVFAIAGGWVERNRLRRDVVVEASDKPDSWFSYTPPPFTLPVDYRSGDKWNHFSIGESRHIFTSAVVMDRTRWKSQNSQNVLQVGELEEFDGAEVRGFRFGMFGVFKVMDNPWTYTLAGATNAFGQGFDTRETSDFTMFDVRLDIPLYGTTLSIGKQKEPQSLERATGMVYLPFQERSMAADALMPSRNTGVVLSDTAFNQRMTWAGGLFNDWLDSGGSRSDSASQVVARMTGIPFVSENESNLVHMGFGYRHSDSKEGFATGATPEVDASPEFLTTGPLFDLDRMETWNYELGYRRGPFWLMAEYTSADLADTPYGDLNLSGYYVAASWIVTGEMRPYNHKSGVFGAVPIAKPVNAGGYGAFELGIRYSTLDLTDKTLQGGEAEVYTLAANWWLRSNMSFSVNLQRTFLDKPAADSMSPVLDGSATGLVTRVLLVLD